VLVRRHPWRMEKKYSGKTIIDKSEILFISKTDVLIKVSMFMAQFCMQNIIS
jgi:hypothetical protein